MSFGILEVMQYKAIGFDWGGVIYGRPGPMFSKEAAETLDVSHEQFQEVYFSLNDKINKGGVSMELFWQRVLVALDRSEYEERLVEFMNNLPGKSINQDVLDILIELKERGNQLGLFSNNRLAAASKIREAVGDYFEVILISEEVGCMKPEARAFELLAEALGVQVGELVYVDDTPEVVVSADEVGYRAVIFENVGQLRKELIALGLL